MTGRGTGAGDQQQESRRGSMPLFGNSDTIFDVFRDGDELIAVTDPYEFPVFYHIGQREDGSWHVLEVEEHDYPLEAWGDQTELERQLRRVRGMRRLRSGEDGRRDAIGAMDLYVHFESPEAEAKWDASREGTCKLASGGLAEVKGADSETEPERPHEPRARRRHRRGPRLFGGVFLTFGGK